MDSRTTPDDPSLILQTAQTELEDLDTDRKLATEDREQRLRGIHSKIQAAMDGIDPRSEPDEQKARAQYELVEALEATQQAVILKLQNLGDAEQNKINENRLKENLGSFAHAINRLAMELQNRNEQGFNALVDDECLYGFLSCARALSQLTESLDADELQRALSTLFVSIDGFGQAPRQGGLHDDSDSLEGVMGALRNIYNEIDTVMESISASGGSEKFGSSRTTLSQAQSAIPQKTGWLQRKLENLMGY